MYYIKNGKKVKNTTEHYSKAAHKNKSNDTLKNIESKCGKWIYIVSGIIIVLMAILLIYFFMTDTDKSKSKYKSNKKITEKSTEQQFGFRFY